MGFKNKKGQAMLETILLVPFIVVIIFFIYQAYITVNKVQIVQKQLKSQVIGKLFNRYESTVEIEDETANNKRGESPKDGKYFYIYDDSQGMVNAGLDSATVAILLTFMRKDQGQGLEERLTNNMTGKQALGLCIGGGTAMGDQVDPAVLKMQADVTCNRK